MTSQPQRVLVAGTGSAVTERLLPALEAAGHRVLALDDADAVRVARPTVVIHEATTLSAARDLLHACERHGVQRFVAFGEAGWLEEVVMDGLLVQGVVLRTRSPVDVDGVVAAVLLAVDLGWGIYDVESSRARASGDDRRAGGRA